MLSIDIRHPDVEHFITIKKDLTKVTGANISVMVRDDFMEAVKQDKDYILRWPCVLDHNEATIFEDTKYISQIPYNELQTSLYSEGFNEKTLYWKKVKAKELWNKLIEAAHGSAEPGILFVDRHWDYSPDTVYPKYKGVTTNP